MRGQHRSDRLRAGFSGRRAHNRGTTHRQLKRNRFANTA
jgi:hypothetical protein